MKTANQNIMKIYGVEIKMPHSIELSRSQVLTLLQKSVKSNYCGVGNFDKNQTKDECNHYNSLRIEDINGEFRTTLS
jgi:hypothetical protein